MVGTRTRVSGALPETARALVMALVGACVMAVALGTAGAVTQAAHTRTGMTGIPRQALAAVICLVLAVSLIVLLRRGVDRRPMSGLGLTSAAAGLRTFGLGVVVTGVRRPWCSVPAPWRGG